MNPSEVLLLNVDDVVVSRYPKTRELRRLGYQVIEAESGREALEKVEQNRPSLVLLDVQLPDMNGLEVCAIIKRSWPEIMVLQTSASFTTMADRIRGLDHGADAYLVQPAEPEELAATVQALLRIRTAEDALRKLNENLEQRVDERTRDLLHANEQLRKEMKRREKAEAALVQSQKMEAIGQLTGGIAHDFNNLLTAIVGSLDLISTRSGDERIKRLADNALKGAARGAKLTAQLLAFSRVQKLETEPIDINALVTGMGELLRQSLGPEVRLQLALGTEVGLAVGDANQLELAILNLAINARDAMPHGGAVTITTADVEIGNDDGVLAPGRYIKIAVEDDGTGMPPDVVARAFDPFFTTKPPGKGTGLGLAQVYGIAKQCGGEARITSEPGRGTTVGIWLGRTTQPVAAREGGGAGRPAAAPTRGEIILVDDDPDIQRLLPELLTELGYLVSVADSGSAGLRLLNERRPDLLILDFAMPEMNGAEIAKVVRARDPDLPILFLSGYADTSSLESAAGDAAILRKPFRLDDLATAVGNAMKN